MIPVRVRPYASADRAGCLAVFDSNVPGFFGPWERDEFEAYLDDPPGPYLVLEGPGGEVVGCGGWAVAPGSDCADLCWGMVRWDLQGGGLGRLLTEARIEMIREAGTAREVALATSQLTTGFYERMGFQVRRVVGDGHGPGLDRCEMRMEL